MSPRRSTVPPRIYLLAGTLALAAAGCGDPPDQSTDWQYLHATIIEPFCATSGCHSYANGQLGDMVDFSTPDAAWVGLIDSPDVDECGDPFDVDDSSWLSGTAGHAPDLLRLLHGTYPASDFFPYEQMPADVPLAPAQIRAIEDWVAAGAPCE
jgi:hypothetical protein